MKDCLEEHREDAEFSSECKAEFERMMQFRAADFRLDSSLREACAADIEDVCGYEKVRAHMPDAPQHFLSEDKWRQAEAPLAAAADVLGTAAPSYFSDDTSAAAAATL